MPAADTIALDDFGRKHGFACAAPAFHPEQAVGFLVCLLCHPAVERGEKPLSRTAMKLPLVVVQLFLKIYRLQQ